MRIFLGLTLIIGTTVPAVADVAPDAIMRADGARSAWQRCVIDKTIAIYSSDTRISPEDAAAVGKGFCYSIGKDYRAALPGVVRITLAKQGVTKPGEQVLDVIADNAYEKEGRQLEATVASSLREFISDQPE